MADFTAIHPDSCYISITTENDYEQSVIDNKSGDPHGNLTIESVRMNTYADYVI